MSALNLPNQLFMATIEPHSLN